MPTGINLQAFIFWDEQQTDCSACYLCKDVIVTNMFRMVLSIGSIERFDTAETRVIICAPCMEIINEQKEKP